MFRKRLTLLVVGAGILLMSGCANPCGCRFPMLRRIALRIRYGPGWCPDTCGQAIEAASVPLCGDGCTDSFSFGSQPVGFAPTSPCCEGAADAGPFLNTAPMPSFPMMPRANDGTNRLVPQPQIPLDGGQAQPRPYVPQ